MLLAKRITPTELQENVILSSLYTIWYIGYLFFVRTDIASKVCTGSPYFFLIYCRWILPIGFATSMANFGIEYWTFKKVSPTRQKPYATLSSIITGALFWIAALTCFFCFFSSYSTTCQDSEIIRHLYTVVWFPFWVVALYFCFGCIVIVCCLRNSNEDE